MTTLIVPSYAKINWTLEILGRRPDGYHELRTLLQTISLRDRLTFTEAEDGIELATDDPQLPADRSNLVWRAANALLELTGVRRGAGISIEKRIPMGAGLGGGSSNAAVTLLALNRLWDTRLDLPALHRLAARLGSDVPFFLTGGTGLGVGRGEEVYPVADINEEHILLVNPGLHIPTAEVYSGLPPELTNPEPLAKMPLSFEAAHAAVQVGIGGAGRIIPFLHNDLEIPVLRKYSVIPEIRARLRDSGASGVLMSGSGSTVFAIFDSEEACSAAAEEMPGFGWWCASVRTLDRRRYQSEIDRAINAIQGTRNPL